MGDLPRLIRDVLDAARGHINRQHPGLAKCELRRIEHEVVTDTVDWAEHRLLLAEAFRAEMDPACESFFIEAITCMKSLSEPPISLLIQAMEHWGDFLCAMRRPSKARGLYEEAHQFAIESQCNEDVKAHLKLRLIRIDLETDRDPQLENYKVMKRVAERVDCPFSKQLCVWFLHMGTMEQQEQNLRFARKKHLATESYFENIFDSVRDDNQ